MAGKRTLALDKHQWHPSPLPGQVVLVTTVDANGQPSVATKSWVSMAAFGPPPILMFGCNMGHATARNAIDQGEFVVNIPGCDLIETAWAVGSDTVPPGMERFRRNGLSLLPSELVKPPRIAECRAHLECVFDSVRQWGDEVALFGRVVTVSVDQDLVGQAVPASYAALAPFFFLEGGWAAQLCAAQEANNPRPPATS
ncbi:MAG: flavin reductase family protein [Oligoflexia bacterium]|nr:flavin reductase family protein [Oligoflexia bacterium]